MPTGIIESLDHDARGITRLDGKTIFVEGALPGELVEFVSFRKKSSFEVASVTRILRASAQRVSPPCPHFGVCGGCSLQHLDAAAQVAAKQRVLESSLWHLGRLKPDELYAPIYGAPWGYRFRARLTAHYLEQKGATAAKMLIGFHERKSTHVADISQCLNLSSHVSALLVPLRELVGSLSIRRAVPQIEVAVGESGVGEAAATVTTLVLRILSPLSEADQVAVRAFADQHHVVFYLQPGAPTSAYRLYPIDGPQLAYRLPDFAIEHVFSPTEFTQVNHAVNQVLVRRALALLAPQAGERIADMFCGLGNFTLPIARSGAQVLGIEGSAQLVQRAQENAMANGLAEHVDYVTSNLFAATAESLARLGRFDKMLIDPPREGAVELVNAFSENEMAPRRIVYVSCNPATLARDGAILVRQKGYRLRGAGVINMFPNTSHVESIALFEK